MSCLSCNCCNNITTVVNIRPTSSPSGTAAQVVGSFGPPPEYIASMVLPGTQPIRELRNSSEENLAAERANGVLDPNTIELTAIVAQQAMSRA